MQRKLTQWQIEKLKQAKEGIRAGLAWNSSDEGDEYWSEAVRKIDLKIEYGTSDGKPYVEPEPPLTDKDACVWPRLLVMVRDNDTERWEGPFQYVGKLDDKPFAFVVYREDGLACVWKHARRATPEEIEAAK